MRTNVIVRVALVGILAGSSIAQARAEYLTTEEAAWIEAVRTHKTKDGTTVEDVLQYVSTMRPGKFTRGVYMIRYNHQNKPAGVRIDYWIGLKREVDDTFFDLGYTGHKTRKGFVLRPVDSLASEALDAGRDAFLREMDEDYDRFCIDVLTHKTRC
jgi:hypothetical protein